MSALTAVAGRTARVALVAVAALALVLAVLLGARAAGDRVGTTPDLAHAAHLAGTAAGSPPPTVAGSPAPAVAAPPADPVAGAAAVPGPGAVPAAAPAPAAGAVPGAAAPDGAPAAGPAERVAGSAPAAAAAKKPKGLAEAAGAPPPPGPDDAARAVDDGTAKLAEKVRTGPAKKVSPKDVLPQHGLPNGCVAGYGRGAACLPQTPPSKRGHGHARGPDMSVHWTCTEVRAVLPEGIAVDTPGKDRLELDSDGDGTACGPGDA